MRGKKSFFRHKRNHRRRKPRHVGSRWFLPALEWLEPRIMLAGNVTAAVTGGDLILTGDAESNSVEVSIVDGDLVVQGFDNTTINGDVAPFVAFAGSTIVTDDFFASLRGGDDVLVVKEITITDRASVAAHAGDDRVGFESVTVGTDLRLLTAHGADTINLENVTVDRNVIMNTSKHRDAVRIADSDIGRDLRVRLAQHADVIVLDTVTVGDDVGINGGGGSDDVVLMDAIITDRLGVNMRGGDDFLYIDPSMIGGSTGIRGGPGDDMVVIEGANQLNHLSLRLGRGSDAGKIDPATTFSGRVATRNMEARDVSDADRDAQLNDPTNGALTRSNAAENFFKNLGNTAPTVVGDGIDEVMVDEDAMNEIINLLDVFDDAEDGAAGLVFEVSNNTNASLFSSTLVSNSAGTLTLGFAPDAFGIAEISVSATDTRGLSVEDIFTVTVNPVDEIPLTLNALAGGGIQSNDTVITNDSTYTISGTTEPDADIRVDSDGDGFDDGSATANGAGIFSVTVPLVHNDNNNGANTVRVQASNNRNQVTTTSADIHLAVGTVVRYTTNLSDQATFDVELLDADAPRTVANFLGYLDRYQNLIVQRSSKNSDGSDFVIQAGRFTHNGTTLVEVQKDDSIQNEHSNDNLNLRGTLSMALGSDIFGNTLFDSGTSEWFVNMSDANTFLDGADRMHTVFGRVIGSGMDVADRIHDLPIQNLNAQFGSSALSNVPLQNFIAGTPVEDNFVIFSSIAVLLDPTVVDNTFNVDENTAADTVVGTVTASSPVSGSAVFEIEDPTLPVELKLTPDDHTLGNPAAEVVAIEYIDYG